MVMHLVKLCVGVSSVEELEASMARTASRRRAAGEPPVSVHVTRMTPAKRDEVENGGSLYWVIGGAIRCRSDIISLEAVDGEDGVKRCAIVMSTEVVRTAAAPRRPFQGWRYLKPEDAPQDVDGPVEGGDELPPDLRAKLLEIGAW